MDVSIDRFYDQNDTIAAFRSSPQATSGYISNGPGLFQLPKSDFGGACNDLNYVGFEINIRSPKSCERSFDSSSTSSFQVQCQTDQSVARYVSDLFLARNAEIQASSGVSSSNDVIGVQIQKVYYYDSALETTTEITNDFITNSCGTTFYDDVSLSSGFVRTGKSCLFTPISSWTELDTATANFSTAVMFCASVVKDVVYYVNHSSSARGTLQRVFADVVVTDLAAPLLPSFVSKSPYPVSLSQSFAITFESDNIAQRSADNGNIVTR